ncbi:peptidyl-tRNA hydrolase [Nanohaloarchaea archaeon]|nr:peptidyl-tRNA hydrolase [Candidatus Nanohaloarchaea archaeon]
MGLKQVLLLRDDVGMSCGKMISQGSHACLKAYRKLEDGKAEEWLNTGGKKIALAVSEEELIKRFQRAKDQGLTAAMVKDAGMTEIEPGTKTAAAIGPDKESEVDKVTGDLKLMK